MLRTVDGRAEPPTQDETKAAPECAGHLWRRVILAPKMARGPNWGGAKGHWALWLLAGAAAWAALRP